MDLMALIPRKLHRMAANGEDKPGGLQQFHATKNQKVCTKQQIRPPLILGTRNPTLYMLFLVLLVV